MKSPNRDRRTAAGFNLYRSVILSSTRFGACDWQFGRPQGNTEQISATRYGKIRLTTSWDAHGFNAAGSRVDEIINDGFSRYWTASMVRADAPYNNPNVLPTGGIPVGITAESRTRFTANVFPVYHVVVELLDADEGFADRMVAEARAVFNSTELQKFDSSSALIVDPFDGKNYYLHTTRAQWAMGPSIPTIDGDGVRSSHRFDPDPSLRKVGLVVGNSAGGYQFGTGDPNWPYNFFFAAAASKSCGALQTPSGLPPPNAPLANTGRFAQQTVLLNTWVVVLQRVQVYTSRANRWTFSQPIVNEIGARDSPVTQVACEVNADIPGGSLEPPTAALVTDYGITYYAKCYPPFPNTQGRDHPSCFTVPPVG